MRKPSEQKEDFKINENVLDINEKFIGLSELVEALLARSKAPEKTVVRKKYKKNKAQLGFIRAR